MKNKEKISCKYCGSGNFVKRGFRRTKTGNTQLFYCKNCDHKFSVNCLNQKKFNANAIIEAMCKYNLGYSCSEAADIIKSKYKITAGESSVSRWANEMRCPYLKIRGEMIKAYGRTLIVSKMFKHTDLIYHFKYKEIEDFLYKKIALQFFTYHKAKLMRFGKFSGLKEFIVAVGDKGIDNRMFSGSDNNRCSQIKFDAHVRINHYENKFLNKLVYSVLKCQKSKISEHAQEPSRFLTGCNNNNKRHSIIEKFLLCCDRDTVAVEVPVWYWDKKKKRGVCGHAQKSEIFGIPEIFDFCDIDILQVKFGKVWIMDFKPNAASENVDKVVSQLWLYARALSFRAGVGLEDIVCCWFHKNQRFLGSSKIVNFRETGNPKDFQVHQKSSISACDWNDIYSFNPGEVKIR